MTEDCMLTRRLAERVMGWWVFPDETDWRVHCLERRGQAADACCIKEDGTVLIALPSFGIHRWRPLESMDDAWMLVTRLQADGWHYEIGDHITDPDIHAAEFGRGYWDHYNYSWSESVDAAAPTPQRAIVLAALKTQGVEIS